MRLQSRHSDGKIRFPTRARILIKCKPKEMKIELFLSNLEKIFLGLPRDVKVLPIPMKRLLRDVKPFLSR